MINTDVDVLNTNFSHDQIRSLSIGGQYDWADDWQGINLINLNYERGLGILGATSDGAGRSRINAEHDYGVFTADAHRLQRLSGPWAVLVEAAGQYAQDPLLAAKEFALGGAAFGRGYDNGEIVGDHAIAYNAELRYSGDSSTDWLADYQYYVFIDGGKIWNRDRVFGDVASDSLTSTGIGSRFNFVNNWSASAELSVPLTKRIGAEGGAGSDPRVFFNLIKHF